MKCWCGSPMVQLKKNKVCATTQPKAHEKKDKPYENYLSEYTPLN